MDWASALVREATTSPLLRIGDAAAKYRLSHSAVSKALRRQASRGLLEKLSDDTYLNKLAASPTPRDFVNQLVPDSYVSLASALGVLIFLRQEVVTQKDQHTLYSHHLSEN